MMQLNLRVQKNINIEKIAIKVVQMKFLTMHVTNQKCGRTFINNNNNKNQNIFIEHDLYLMSKWFISQKKNL